VHLARVRAKRTTQEGVGSQTSALDTRLASGTSSVPSGSLTGVRHGNTRGTTPVKNSAAIGRRLYAALEDVVGRKNVKQADELLVVVGYSKSNVMLRVWDVSGGSGLPVAPGTETVTTANTSARYSSTVPPKLVAHKSVIKALKLLDSDVESVAVDTAEWPKVYVAVGTATGRINVYCCRDIGVGGGVEGGSLGEFALVHSTDLLKVKNGKGAKKSKSSRVQFVSFASYGFEKGSASGLDAHAGRAPSASPCSSPCPRSSLLVWGVSEHGMVIGFDALSSLDASIILDEVPGQLKRGCVSQDDRGALAIATRDGLFYYTMHEGRTVAISAKGGDNKVLIAAGDEYMVLIADEDPGVDRRQVTMPPVQAMRRVTVQILQVGQKIVAYSTSLPGPVRIITAANSSYCDSQRSYLTSTSGQVALYALDGAGSMLRLSEKPFCIQIDELCRSKLYSQALRLCERARDLSCVDDDEHAALAARVNKMYGDYLFERKAFESAMDVYIDTIGFVETSHVIQKFLDGGAQQVGQLTRYLKALLAKSLATGDHISLLMQAFLDIEDTSNVDELVEVLCLRRGELAESLDARAAIEVLRRAGFVEHALDIAKAYDEDELYVSIMLNQRCAYEQVLDYLKTRPRAFAVSQILRHGKALIEHASEATTELLVDIYMDPESYAVAGMSAADLANLSQLYADKAGDFCRVCQVIVETADGRNARNGSHGEETLFRKRLYHALLDTYLVGSQNNDSLGALSDAPLVLLQRGWPPGHAPSYDPVSALTTCALHDYSKGIVFIHMRMRRFRDAVELLADVGDWLGVLEVCRAHGHSVGSSDGGDPSLWRVALMSMVNSLSREKPDERLHAHLGGLLEAIHEAGTMAPLFVLDILGKAPELPFGVVKSYIVDILQEEIECIDAMAAEIAELTDKIEATNVSLQRLDARPLVFRATRDSSTGKPLRIPLIHFACGHSFNAADDEGVQYQDGASNSTRGIPQPCSLCVEEQERTRALQASYRAAARDKDAFFRQLQSTDDGFAFVSRAFAKGFGES
jgi:hypothetical protein